MNTPNSNTLKWTALALLLASTLALLAYQLWPNPPVGSTRGNADVLHPITLQRTPIPWQTVLQKGHLDTRLGRWRYPLPDGQLGIALQPNEPYTPPKPGELTD